MKNTRTLFVIIALALSVSGATHAQTTVSGSIYSSTTWTLSGSPYTITSSIVLFDGDTLTIQPGVVVKFADDVTFEVRGALVAVGTSTNRITFTSANSSPSPGIYKGIQLKTLSGNIKMAYCDASYAYKFLDMEMANGIFNIHHCGFYNNYVAVECPYHAGTMSTFDSCRFEANKTGMNQYDCEGTAINCLFINNETGANVQVALNCVFTGNTSLGVYAYTTMQHCEIYGNNVGAEWDGHYQTMISYNNIHDNTIGVQLDRFWNDPNSQFFGNKICSNSTWNVLYKWNNSVSLKRNCWCSTDSSYIRSKIRDGYVDATYGLISFDVGSSCSAGITSVPDPATFETEVKVYPNPFYENAIMEFNYDRTHAYSVDIKDETGRTVKTIENIRSGVVTISSSNLPPGMYFYVLKNESQLLSTGKIAIE